MRILRPKGASHLTPIDGRANLGEISVFGGGSGGGGKSKQDAPLSQEEEVVVARERTNS